MKPTPVDPKAPGVLIPATAITNVLQNEGLKIYPTHWGLMICFFSALLSLLVIRNQKGPSWATFGLFSVSIFGSAVVSVYLWIEGYWLSPVPVAVSGLVSGICGTIWISRTVWRNHFRLAKMVQHSMSPEMVELIRKGEVNFSRFGELRQVTVLFSDLVGFTEMSEDLPPEELVKILNGYFDEVVALVTEGSGYVDKFIGDAVMAVWGAPIQQSDHATLALNAAIHFHKAAERFNEKLERTKPHLKPLGTRVGIHTGNAIVGNIGARHRHNYTAIGDSVNLSARLESLCKMYGIHLIISEDCLIQANAMNKDGFVELDNVMVKGKSTPTRIFTHTKSLSLTDRRRYKTALKCYYQGDWEQALKYFEGIDFAPSEVMANRCRKALERGGLDEWKDGVWVFDSK